MEKLETYMKHRPQVQTGDFFGSTNPMALGRGINAIQWFWSKDAESIYSHSGIITGEDGTTLEALWTVKSGTLFTDYAGDKVIIARYMDVSPARIRDELRALREQHEGNIYPFWRLGMHLFPPLAKVTWFDRLVCSELVAKYLYMIGARHPQYAGTSPDVLADEWHRWKNFEIVFEGELQIL